MRPKTVSPAPQLPLMLSVAMKAGGLEAAAGLASAFGGQRIYIPLERDAVADHHPLVKAAGRAAADAVMARFGGEHVEIPTGRTLRRHIALRLLEEGERTRNEIARLTSLSHREVRRLSAAMKAGLRSESIDPSRSRRRANPAQIDLEDYLGSKS